MGKCSHVMKIVSPVLHTNSHHHCINTCGHFLHEQQCDVHCFDQILKLCKQKKSVFISSFKFLLPISCSGQFENCTDADTDAETEPSASAVVPLKTGDSPVLENSSTKKEKEKSNIKRSNNPM